MLKTRKFPSSAQSWVSVVGSTQRSKGVPYPQYDTQEGGDRKNRIYPESFRKRRLPDNPISVSSSEMHRNKQPNNEEVARQSEWSIYKKNLSTQHKCYSPVPLPESFSIVDASERLDREPHTRRTDDNVQHQPNERNKAKRSVPACKMRSMVLKLVNEHGNATEKDDRESQPELYDLVPAKTNLLMFRPTGRLKSEDSRGEKR